MNIKFNLKFIVITLIVSLIIVPILFNIFFMWDSGLSRGEMSDWFVLYGNIFGGLIGGFFTYLALLLTLNDKKKEMMPKIDIPYQSIDFIDSEFKQIVIELNNIGGSIAKNIECTLSLENFEEVLEVLEKHKENLGIDLLMAKTALVDDILNMNEKGIKSAHLFAINKENGLSDSLGGVNKEYKAEFIGSCIPLNLNHEAKIQYILGVNINNWINYLVRHRDYKFINFNEKELFNFNLKVKYSSDEFGEISDCFKLEWKYIGMIVENERTEYQYVLKSTKVDKKTG